MRKIALKTALLTIALSLVLTPALFLAGCVRVTNVGVTGITATSAIISWDSEVPATSWVEYGVTDALGLTTVIDEEMVTGHAVQLTELAPGTLYYYRPCSTAEGATGSPAEIRTFETPPAPYVLVTLDSVKVLNDEDPTAHGEIEIATLVGTGDKVQGTRSPIRIWHEADDGDTILVNLPIFCVKEDEMGEGLAIQVTVVDNDELTDWVDFVIGDLPGHISDLVKVIPEKPDWVEEAAEWAADIGRELADWLGENEIIGFFGIGFTRDDNWGIRTAQYQAMVDDMVVTFSVHEVQPSGRPVTVRLKPIKIHENADSWPWEGEIFVWARVADGFYGDPGMLDAVYTRRPSSGTSGKDDGDWFGGSWSAGYLTIFNTNQAGPFLHVEVDVWDEDNPWIGDDHDSLGVFAELYEPLPQGPFTRTYNRTITAPSGGKATVEWEVIGY